MDASTAAELSWAIAGQSGEGIDSTGEIFARALHRLGYHVHAYRNFPSRIKGGCADYTARAALRPVRCQADQLQFLVALDPDCLPDLWPRLAPEAVVICEATAPAGAPAPRVAVEAVPFTALARDAGNPIAKNMVALGLSAALLGLPRDAFAAALEHRFGRKGELVLEQNLAALQKGQEVAARLPARVLAAAERLRLPAVPAGGAPRADGPRGNGTPAAGGRLFISGNEAAALGALAAGCRFYAGYPITPATEIMTWLVRWLPRVGGAVIQTEDEIAAITMAIGAGYAGVRAMTASSGPGFSLMMEALSLAGMTETPVVIVDVQRGGPSTGLPTKTEQANLNEMLWGSHGDFPRIVLAAATPEDCFYLTAEGFNLAERYQCPVVIASDLALALSRQTVEGLDPRSVRVDRGALVSDADLAAAGPGGYRRYALTPDGISPRALPGQRLGRHLVTGDEHDEAGRITEDPTTRARMMRKRLDKLAALDLADLGLVYEGTPDPDLLLVGWGSTYGAIAEARQALEARGRRAAHLHVKALHPLPAARAAERLRRAARVLVVEQNATGQLAGLIRRETGFTGRMAHCLKFDGVPIHPGEILARAEAALRTPPDGRPAAPGPAASREEVLA